MVNGHIDRHRAEGKLVNLESRLAAAPTQSGCSPLVAPPSGWLLSRRP